MKEFKTYHPIVNLIYFLSVIGFSMACMNPVYLLVSIVCSFVYACMQKGTKAVKTNLIFILPMMLTTALLNPAFNHQGTVILCYLPGGNPLTLESIIYGLAAAVMLAAVINWFSCYNEIMTSDKFIYLFGRIIPSMSLIMSMTLRFVPEFSNQLRRTANAQKCIGRDVSQGSIIKRAKSGLSVLSAMITWALERSIETADSMKSRGYGLSARTAFSIFKFDRRDLKTLICIIVLSVIVLAGRITGYADFTYFPSMVWGEINLYSILSVVSYLMLCLVPIVIELWEERKWKYIKSKI